MQTQQRPAMPAPSIVPSRTVQPQYVRFHTLRQTRDVCTLFSSAAA